MSQAGLTITPCPSASFPRPTDAPRPRRCAVEIARGEGRVAAGARHRRGARQLGGCRGPAAARVGRARADLACGFRAHRRHVPHELPAGRAARGAACSRRSVAGPCPRRWSRPRSGACSRPIPAGCSRPSPATPPPRRRWSARTVTSPISTIPRSTRLAEKSERAREVVRIHRLVKERLAPQWYDEHDLMRAAIEVVHEGSPLVAELGTIACHLPQRVTGPIARLLRALAERTTRWS